MSETYFDRKRKCLSFNEGGFGNNFHVDVGEGLVYLKWGALRLVQRGELVGHMSKRHFNAAKKAFCFAEDSERGGAILDMLLEELNLRWARSPKKEFA